MRIYLDCCCLNRPFDDQSQERVRIETAALEIIMERIGAGDWVLLGSDVLEQEIAVTPDPKRRRALLAMLLHAREWVSATPEVIALARTFVASGVDAMDAMHLASASVGGADVFLTVDIHLYRRTQKFHNPKPVATHLPAAWLEGLNKESPP